MKKVLVVHLNEGDETVAVPFLGQEVQVQRVGCSLPFLGEGRDQGVSVLRRPQGAGRSPVRDSAEIAMHEPVLGRIQCMEDPAQGLVVVACKVVITAHGVPIPPAGLDAFGLAEQGEAGGGNGSWSR